MSSKKHFKNNPLLSILLHFAPLLINILLTTTLTINSRRIALTEYHYINHLLKIKRVDINQREYLNGIISHLI
jgi:hypothetical protein